MNRDVKSHLLEILEKHSEWMHARPGARNKKWPGCKGATEGWEGVYRLLCLDLSGNYTKEYSQ